MSVDPNNNNARRLSIFFSRLLAPASVTTEGGIDFWRERVFHFFTFFLVVIGFIAYVFFTVSFVQNEQLGLVTLSTVLFLSALFTTVVKSLRFKSRVIIILTVMYLLGGAIQLVVGPYSSGLMVLLSFSMLSVILLGTKPGLYSLALNAVAFVVTGVFQYKPIYSTAFLTDVPLSQSLNVYFIFFVISLITIVPLISLLNGMNFSLEKEKRYKDILQKKREKLFHAKEKAVQSDYLKTAFLANMSHEIRTPMNAILGFSNLLGHEGIGDEEKKEFVKLIKINGKNLLTLVEDLIDISKIDSGQLQIKNTHVCLHDVMMEVYDSYLADIEHRGYGNIVKLYLKEGISDPDVRVLTDGVRLRQILAHLVGNALKFTERGFVEFGYKLVDEEKLQFYVKDTGIGVPADKKDMIFERFSKLTDKTHKLYGGTGIGLSIAKDLVDLMGGDIWFQSEQKVGTTFYCTLPFQLVTKVDSDKDKKLSEPVVHNWVGKTFLVVEDEEDNFRYLEVALSISNASLIWARNGLEAIDIVKKINNIDLVLMDIKMPEMDGYEATKEIKRIKPEIPVIAQTAYAMSEEREKSMSIGCDDYIAKPIGYEDLLNTIHRFVPGVNCTKKELIDITSSH